MRKFRLEIKITLGIILFTLIIASLERYELSQNIITQFVESKKSKNKLLVDTMLAVISLDISLGLDDSANEYLNRIIKQNSDIKLLLLKDGNDKIIYQYPNNVQPKIILKNDMMHHYQLIKDDLTNQKLGSIYIQFSSQDYDNIISKNRIITMKIATLTIVLLAAFLFFIHKQFKHLKELTDAVLVYDPKLNNFILAKSKKQDEVSIVHNAIVDMVERIEVYTHMLDEINDSLEEKVLIRTKELQEANRQLEMISQTDALTQIPNRRRFESYTQEIWDLAVRTKTMVSIVICDVDFFKKINDKYGHIVGDEILKNVVQIIKQSLKRSSDLVARYGGEEFVIVLYDTNKYGAEELCEKIAHNLRAAQNFYVHGMEIDPITMSFGISSTIAKNGYHYMDLLDLADNALYKAKESGRDRIVIEDRFHEKS